MLRVPDCNSFDIHDFCVFFTSFPCGFHRCYKGSYPITRQASCTDPATVHKRREEEGLRANEVDGLDEVDEIPEESIEPANFVASERRRMFAD